MFPLMDMNVKRCATVQGDPDEINPDPGFDNLSGWTTGGGWTIANSQAAGANTSSFVYRGAALLPGETYRLTYEIAEISGGSVQNYVDSNPVTGQARLSPGVYSDDLTPVSGNEFGLKGTGFTGKINYLSVKLVEGN